MGDHPELKQLWYRDQSKQNWSVRYKSNPLQVETKKCAMHNLPRKRGKSLIWSSVFRNTGQLSILHTMSFAFLEVASSVDITEKEKRSFLWQLYTTHYTPISLFTSSRLGTVHSILSFMSLLWSIGPQPVTCNKNCVFMQCYMYLCLLFRSENECNPLLDQNVQVLS